MKNRLSSLGVALACFLVVLSPLAASANVAKPTASQGGVSWQISAPNGGVTLRVSQPDGKVFEQKFARGQSPVFSSPSGILPDGTYTYELRLAPVGLEETQDQAPDEPGKALTLPSGSVESGSFRVVGGVVKVPDLSTVEIGNNPSVPQDIFTDVVIQANNTRLLFDDNSSPAASFSFNDWELRANDTFSNGLDRFSILDVTGGTTPFTIRGGAPTNSLYVAPSGNVGLRTTVPARQIHIFADLLPSIRLQQGLSGSEQIWDIRGNAGSFFISDVTANQAFAFAIRAGTGDVGIGTSIPAGKLHVRGSGNHLSIFQSSDNMAVQFRLQTDSTNRRFIALNTAGAQQSQLVFGDSGAFDFLGATAGDVRLRLLANGNVGIGTTAPTQKLSVNGTAGKPGGGSWSTFSDERLKNIKGDYRSGLEAVMQLQPIRYEYKNDNALGLKSEGEHVGFAAQAVEKVIPEAVTKTADGYLMVNNDPILWTMLNAIKEQNAEIKEQNAEIGEQNAELKEQKKEIARLKEQLERLQARVTLRAGHQGLPSQPAVARAIR